jgi:hypothetical protein
MHSPDMHSLDEQTLSELMRSSTGDLHVPAGLAGRVVTRHRRRALRRRALGVAVTGAAAGTAIGVIASGVGVTGPRDARTPAGAIALTAAQQTLRHLSSVAAGSAGLAGRYVTMKEVQDGNVHRTSVIDTRTGDVWTFQSGPGVPAELPVARHDSPTQAQYNAIPTDTAALRRLLIRQFYQQRRQARAMTLKQVAAQEKKTGKPAPGKAVVTQPKFGDNDIVFEQATDMLWSPLVGPSLRAALLKVLEETPGIRVDPSATDAADHPAVEISRVNRFGETIAVYENPSSATVLETSFAGPTGNGSDLYLSVTSSDTPPSGS